MYLRTLLYEQALSGETCKTLWGDTIVITEKMVACYLLFVVYYTV
jgi:hypothetical protein